LQLEPGTERYRVRGGGATVVALSAGDRITITDVEGRQRCEMSIFSPTGREDAAGLGARADVRSQGLAALLETSEEDARAVLAALRQHGIEARGALAVQLFLGDTRPGDRESFTAEREVICVVAAPGRAMRVDEQNPPTELRVTVKRAR